MSTSEKPTRFAVALFPGFQALDVFGPLDILNMLSRITPLTFHVLAETLTPVSTQGLGTKHTISQSVVPTHTFADAPLDDIDVLLVPGGFGTRNPVNVDPVVEFLRRAGPKVKYLLTVCTGSALAAMAGVLDGKRATSNKMEWDWVGLFSFFIFPFSLFFLSLCLPTYYLTTTTPPPRPQRSLKFPKVIQPTTIIKISCYQVIYQIPISYRAFHLFGKK